MNVKEIQKLINTLEGLKATMRKPKRKARKPQPKNGWANGRG